MNTLFDTDILVQKYLDGTLSDEEATELLLRVESDEAAARMLHANVMAHFFLQELGTTPEEEQPGPVTELARRELSWDMLVQLQNAEKPFNVDARFWKYDEQNPGAPTNLSHPPILIQPASKTASWFDFRNSIIPIFSLAGLVFLVTGLTVLFFLSKKEETTETSSTIAQVIDTINVVWDDESETFTRGQLLGENHFILKSGLVQLQMSNGTTMVLSGPSDVTITSPMNAFCRAGNVSVAVTPQANGYEVATPNGTVTDRGTEFHVTVARDTTQVEVVKGRVDYLTPNQELFPLTSLEGVEYNLTSKIRSFSVPKSVHYISPALFKDRSLEQTKVLMARQEKADETILSDTRLLVRLRPGQTTSDLIPNEVESSSSFCPSAKRYKTENTEGVLFGTQAVRFSGKDSRIDFDLKQDVKSLTLVALVRMDAPLGTANVLFSSRHDENSTGEVLWQISKFGHMQAQVIGNHREDPSVFNSFPFLIREKEDGVWRVLAIVFDAQDKFIRFYANGRKLTSVKWPQPVPLSLGNVTLGNTQFNLVDSDRHFPGIVGDFLLYDQALSEVEINQLQDKIHPGAMNNPATN